MIVDETKKIINKYFVMPKKAYGQNFLINKGILERIVSEGKVTKDDYVIEIGPGLGSLSEFLCINAKKVLCYEIDNKMCEILRDTLNAYDNVTIIEGDFLKQNVKSDINKYFGEGAKVKVIANLPYYITTPIMFKLLEVDNVAEEIFMVQKEMGERFTGEVNTKDYNALSVFIKYFTDTKKAFIVGKNNFYPAPNVDSVILHSVINKKEVDIKCEKDFLTFIKLAFSQRRKTMVNNLSSGYKMNKSELEAKLEELGYSKSIRSEALDLNDFVKVYKYLFERG